MRFSPFLFFVACTSSEVTDGGAPDSSVVDTGATMDSGKVDAAMDATKDAIADAAMDAESDATIDATMDAASDGSIDAIADASMEAGSVWASVMVDGVVSAMEY